MATISGTAGADVLLGTAGTDTIDGGDGDDTIIDARGDDTLTGGRGNDLFILRRPYSYDIASPATRETVTILGGSDNDTVVADLAYQTILTGNLGTGDDVLRLSGGVTLRMNLGTGRDVVHLNTPQWSALPNTLDGFTAGTGGDVFNYSDGIQLYTDGVTNPFASGHFTLIQSGANVVLYFNSGGGGGTQNAVVTFNNVTLASLTAENFFGFDPGGAAITDARTYTGTASGEFIDGTVGVDTLHGGDGNDTIYGYYSADQLFGDAGDDTIYGGAAEDLIYGGDGNDTLDGGAHYDQLFGEGGNDVLTGGDWHADLLDGGDGDDTITETGADDTIRGGAGNDIITHLRQGAPVIDAGAGDDTVTIDHGLAVYPPSGQTYTFTVLAGAGNDTVNYSSKHSGAVTINLGTGADTLNVTMGQQALIVILGADSDRIQLDRIYEGFSAVTIRDFQTGDGGDVFDVLGSMADWLNGGTSWDGQTNPFGSGHAQLIQRGVDVVLQLDRDGTGSSAGFVDVAVFRNTTLAGFTDYNFAGAPVDGSEITGVTLTGTAEADTLTGTIRGDTLLGLAGNDTLNGLNGDDRLEGGDGDDTIHGDAGADTIYGGADNDTITDSGRVRLFGEDGNDTITVSRWTGGSYGYVNGGNGDDIIDVNFGTNLTAHSDTVLGGAGNDTVTFSSGAAPGVRHTVSIGLGSGDDTLILGPTGTYASPQISLGTGNDRVVLRADYGMDGSASPGGAVVPLVFSDFTPGDTGDTFDISAFVNQRTTNLIGGNPFAGAVWARLVQVGANVVLEYNQTGGSNVWVVLAVFENTQLAAFTDHNFGFDIDAPSPPGVTRTADPAGSDLRGTFLDDTLVGNIGNDTIEGGAGNDFLKGDDGDDWIIDGAGNDYITAGRGNDEIELGSGSDTLIAGPGNDHIIVIDTADTIDGGPGYDIIEFHAQFINATGGVVWDHAQFTATGGFTLGGNAVTGIEQVDFLDGSAGDDSITYGATYLYNVLLHGNGGNDTLHGGAIEDMIDGGAGNDTIFGFGGADDLVGGLGDDFINGGDGIDAVVGGSGNDQLQGGAGDDEVYGGADDDVARGGDGDDRIDGGTGTDRLLGDAGNDTISLDISAGDSIEGGTGIDTLLIQADTTSGTLTTGINVDFTNIWTGGLGQTDGGTFRILSIERIEASLSLLADTFIIGSGYTRAVTISGNAGNDTLGGGAAADLIRGDQGDDTVYGNGGDDILWGDHAYLGPGGHDTIYGGAGNDQISGQGGNDTLLGEDGNDHIVGDDGDDTLNGGSGDDQLLAGIGNDVLIGGTGRDTFNGGEGDDLILLDAGLNDESSIDGGLGQDTIQATQAGTQLLWTGANITGINTIDANGLGVLTIIGTSAGDTWNLQSLTDGFSTLALIGPVVFDAGAGNDSIYGLSGSQTLMGGAGDDLIDGQAGADTMHGGTGNDRFYVDNAGDTTIELSGQGLDEVYASINFSLGAQVEDLYLTGAAIEGRGNNLANKIVGNQLGNLLLSGGGNDWIDGQAGDDTIQAGIGNDTVLGGLGDDNVRGQDGNDEIDGGEGNDTLYGDNDDDLLIGNAGADRLYGGSGLDTLLGGTDSDQLFGDLGNDLLAGEAGVDQLFGGDGADILFGGEGEDVLNGDAGDDEIIGGAGRDQMFGGAGADYFYYLDGPDFDGFTVDTADRISDFSQADGDKIDLSVIDASNLLEGDQAFSWVGNGAFTKVAGQLRFEQSGGNTMIFGDVNGDGVADFAIRLDGLINLTMQDFVA